MTIKGNLLLVDDEKELLERLEMILEDFADKIYLANDGEEGYEVLKNETIHCVVCDINMPKLNGVELLKKIRAEKINTPFIFYTGHGSSELMLEVVKYGAFDFLNKPLLEGLFESVESGLKLGLKNVSLEEMKDYMISNSEYQDIMKNLDDIDSED